MSPDAAAASEALQIVARTASANDKVKNRLRLPVAMALSLEFPGG